TADLKDGSYTIWCPGGTKYPSATLTVSASGAAASGSATGEGGDCLSTSSASGAATTVGAALSDFKIELTPTTANAGAVEFDATNKGTHPHEIVVVKGIASSALPTDANGKVDEDKLPSGAVMGELEAFSPGKTCGA